jgi:hypothetical protein
MLLHSFHFLCSYNLDKLCEIYFYSALTPLSNAFIKNLRRYPNLHDKEYADERFGPMGPLVLPYVIEVTILKINYLHNLITYKIYYIISINL